MFDAKQFQRRFFEKLDGATVESGGSPSFW
jgi:hypothetical protein